MLGTFGDIFSFLGIAVLVLEQKDHSVNLFLAKLKHGQFHNLLNLDILHSIGFENVIEDNLSEF